MKSSKKGHPNAAKALEQVETTPRTGWGWAATLFGILVFFYLVNGDVQIGNDVSANVYLPVQLLTHGRVTFTEEDSPQLFAYELESANGNVDVQFHSWDFVFHGKTMREHRQSGALRLRGPLYCLSPTKEPGVYANTFGIGTGLFAVPAFAMLKPFVASLQEDPARLWLVGKIVAAAAVAGSAVFLFLTALTSLGRGAAFGLAVVYGLGTCVWTTSSQALWQHGPTELFLSMGTHLLLRRRRDYLTGLAFGLAVACRPTSIIALAAVASLFAINDRRRLVHLCLGALPVGVLLMVYAWMTFGSPFAAGQLALASKIALAKTGNPGPWQTPLHEGILGLLASPSRGLLVYSPIAAVGIWGAVKVWRNPAWRDLRPISLAAGAMFLLAAEWLDWWGGWSWGYRHIVDVTILLAFLAIPVIPSIKGRWWWGLCFGLCCWSFGIQALAAYCYDIRGWNGRWVYDVTGPGEGRRVTYDDYKVAERHLREQGGSLHGRPLSVDSPEYRYRLWSVTDNPILYYLTKSGSARANRKKDIEDFFKQGER